MASAHVIQAALGEGTGSVDLFVTRATDNSSVLEPLHDRQRSRRDLRVVERRSAPLMRGDDALAGAELDHPLLVKIDVQGAESSVLAGMPHLLEQADAVLVEVSFAPIYADQAVPSDVLQRLHAHGLRIAGVAEVPRRLRGSDDRQADLLLVRPADEGGC